jgi:hypothetical protein
VRGAEAVHVGDVAVVDVCVALLRFCVGGGCAVAFVAQAYGVGGGGSAAHGGIDGLQAKVVAVCGVGAIDGIVAKAVLLCDVGAASFPLSSRVLVRGQRRRGQGVAGRRCRSRSSGRYIFTNASSLDERTDSNPQPKGTHTYPTDPLRHNDGAARAGTCAHIHNDGVHTRHSGMCDDHTFYVVGFRVSGFRDVDCKNK